MYDYTINHYYHETSGILLYTDAEILEYKKENASEWRKHIFTRNLTEINFEFTENGGLLDWFNDVFGDPNTAYIVLIIAMVFIAVGVDIVIIWRIRKRREERAYQEFLQMKRMGKNIASPIDEKEKKKNSQ